MSEPLSAEGLISEGHFRYIQYHKANEIRSKNTEDIGRTLSLTGKAPRLTVWSSQYDGCLTSAKDTLDGLCLRGSSYIIRTHNDNKRGLYISYI